MSRRPGIRTSDLTATLTALREFGLEPCALDVMADGTHRWYFTEPAPHDENSLDRELAEFEAAHGEG